MAIGHSLTNATSSSSDDVSSHVSQQQQQQQPASNATPASGSGKKSSANPDPSLPSTASTSAATNPPHNNPDELSELPITGVSYTDAVIRMAIGKIADNIGWHTIGSETLNILTEVTGQYINSMGRNCMRFANMSGRTQVTLPDVGLAFNQLHFNLTGLQEYISCVHPHPVGVKVNRVPAKIRPCNRITFACNASTDSPFGEDIEIGYAVTDSDDEEVGNDNNEDSDDVDNDVSMNSNSYSGSGDNNNKSPSKNKRSNARVFRRSDYYEEWMPAFPESERKSANVSSAAAASSSLMDQNQNSQSSVSSLKETNSEVPESTSSSGLKVSELEVTSHLSSIHLNSSGQIISSNPPGEPDKSFPDDSGPESIFESDEEIDLSNPNSAHTQTPAAGAGSDGHQQLHHIHKPIERLTIKNAASLSKSGMSSMKGSGRKKNQDKSGEKKPKKLLIKVSGLMAGTPTMSPNFHATASSGEPLPPEMEERMDCTIDEVIAAALSAGSPESPASGKKKNSSKQPGSVSKSNSSAASAQNSSKKKDKGKEKEYSSREFVESDDDSDDDDDDDADNNNNKSDDETSLSKAISPAAHHNRKDDRKVTDTIDSVIKSVMSKASPQSHHQNRESPHRSPSSASGRSKHHMTPDRSPRGTGSSSNPATAGSTKSTVMTKAAAKHFPDDHSPSSSTSSKTNAASKIESEAAEILMAFSTKPVEGQQQQHPIPNIRSSPPSSSFSPFNLGKVLASGAFNPTAASTAAAAAAAAASAPIQDMIGQTSDIHPFAPNPPAVTSLPFKTLAMKKAFDNPIFASESASFMQKRPLSPASDSDDEDAALNDNNKDDDKTKNKNKKQRTDEEEEEKRRKKEKKRKKKESRDKEKDKKKKDKKKDKTELTDGSGTGTSSSNIPKLSIKIPSVKSNTAAVVVDENIGSKSGSKSTSTKVKREEGTKGKASGCILISETIKQISSASPVTTIATAGAGKKGKAAAAVVVKKEAASSSSGKKAAKAGKGKSASVKSETVTVEQDDDNEDGDDKVWICPGCKSPDDGSPMIGCDNCEEWYHWTCVGIRKDPEEDSWFCPRCTEKQRKIEQSVSRITGAAGAGAKKEKRKFDEVAANSKSADDGDGNDGRKRKKQKKTVTKKVEKKKQIVVPSDESEDEDNDSGDEDDKDDEDKNVSPSKKTSAVDNEWSCHSCSRVDDSIPMIGCDSCDHWFHWSCVGIVVEPDKNQVWICSDCRRVKPLKKNNKDKFARKSGVT
jgi:hypothetical protein